jgi:hypothetical protein
MGSHIVIQSINNSQLMKGDAILAVDERSLQGSGTPTLYDVTWMREPGTTVALQLQRRGRTTGDWKTTYVNVETMVLDAPMDVSNGQAQGFKEGTKIAGRTTGAIIATPFVIAYSFLKLIQGALGSGGKFGYLKPFWEKIMQKNRNDWKS